MAGAIPKLKDHNIILTLTIVAVFIIWTVDAVYDSFIAHEGEFSSIFLSATEHEPFLRLFMTACFIIFGFLLSRILAKNNRAEESLQKHTAAIESSMDGIAIYNRDGEYVFVNQAYAAINGYENAHELIGKSFKKAYDDDEIARMDQVCLPALQMTGRWRGELTAKRKNGSTYVQEASVTGLEDGGRVCIVRDITWRKKSEVRLKRSEQFLNTIFDSIRDPFCIFDGNFRIIRVNEAYSNLKGKTVDDLIGKKCYEVLENRSSVCEGCVVRKTFLTKDPCAKDKQANLPDGNRVWLEIYTYPIHDEEGKVSHVIEYTRDITDRKRSEEEKRRLIEELEHLSRTDGLTGLMNRRALTDNLEYEVDRSKRYGSPLSLMLCDIDNFKAINDTYGHDAGDQALRKVSSALESQLRKSDMAGRYGGDEFMLILPETSLEGAQHLAEKFLVLMRQIEFEFAAGKKMKLSISIGVAEKLPLDTSIDELIKRADDAMYLSKQAGKDRVSTSRF